ncbi:MAG: hypothetical protein IJT23_06390 [Clostridia bacterium]|nr:hypothetical protein [Clostridia bacterium]
MKKGLSLVTSTFLTYVINGVGWLIFAVAQMMDVSILSLCIAILPPICIIMSAKAERSSKESSDEMSQHNLMRAKTMCVDSFRLIASAILVVLVFMSLLHTLVPAFKGSIEVDLIVIIPLLLGIAQIVIGILFAKYEKDGE